MSTEERRDRPVEITPAMIEAAAWIITEAGGNEILDAVAKMMAVEIFQLIKSHEVHVCASSHPVSSI